MNSRNLDFLRSFAVLLVVGFHLAKFFDWQPQSMRVTDFGLLGVMLFFVHTTLVLMFSLQRQAARSVSDSASPTVRSLFLPFMTRRVFRIYPLSMLVVVFVWLCRIPSDLQFGSFALIHQTRANLIANLLLIQNVAHQVANPGPLWSLPFELQMYVVLPILFVFAVRFKPWWGMIAFWCAAVAVWFAAGHIAGVLPLSETGSRSPVESLLNITRYAPCFLPGVIAYKLWNQPRRLPGFVWPIFLLGVCAVFLFFSGSQPTQTGWFLCFGIGLALCLFRELKPSILTHFTALVARYSYGIYLLHYFAIWLGFVVFKHLNIALQTTIFLATTVGLSVLLYHTIEEPLIGVGVRVAEKLHPLPFPAPVEVQSAKQNA